jgi:putative ABC transport system ATP-binding protein
MIGESVSYYCTVTVKRPKTRAGGDAQSCVDAGSARDVLTLRKVSKSYGVGSELVSVFRDASMTVERGQLAAVLGRRYEGKSALLRLAAGLEQPDEGEVLFCGVRLDTLERARREALLGSQIAWLDHADRSAGMSVVEQVAARLPGRHKPSRAAMLARAVLERVGAGALAGYRWAELSRWQQLLASLAIGIAGRPDLLLIDGLLGGIDRKRIRDAGLMLRGLAHDLDCSVLMSVDDPEAALYADRIWSFRGGRLRPVFKTAAADVIDFDARRARS